jgi:hypothetical protein
MEMSKVKWFDVLSKAPRPQTYGDRFKFTDWSELPHPLKYWIMDKTNGAVAWLNQGAYEGMRLESIKVEDPPYTDNTKMRQRSNVWTPKLNLAQGRSGVWSVYDWATQTLVEPWEPMMLTSDDPDSGPEAYQSFTGGDPIELKPEQIGVVVEQNYKLDDPKSASLIVRVYFGKDSTWFGEGRRLEAKAGRKQHIEMLTNAEGAILWIYTYEKNLKDKKRLMEELNLGEYNSENNPRLKTLTEKGMFRTRDADMKYEDGKRIKAPVIITDKGKSHAPDIDASVFNTSFRNEVRNMPDAPLVLTDFGEWEEMDVGEASKDNRPEWQKQMEDRQ